MKLGSDPPCQAGQAFATQKPASLETPRHWHHKPLPDSPVSTPYNVDTHSECSELPFFPAAPQVLRAELCT